MQELQTEEKRIRVDKKELTIGVILVLLSFLMPALFTVKNFGVLQALEDALKESSQIKLMKASILLVTLNALRAIFHYVGAFYISESFEIHGTHLLKGVQNAVATLFILLVTYRGIEILYHIHYDFSIPAIIVSAFVIVFGRMNYSYISLWKKGLLVALVLIAFQFLDIMPGMLGIPVGLGETSWNVKQAAVILDAAPLLNVEGAVGSLLFCLFALLVLFQLREENNLRMMSVLREQKQEILTQTRVLEMKNRTYQEVQYLAHDLKSPLTAIQTMVGVLKLTGERLQGNDLERETEYLERIEKAVTQMDQMISDILYEGRCFNITTQEIVNIVLAQVSVLEYSKFLRTENHAPEQIVRANRILFPRVLINLLQNSAQAMTDECELEILLRVEADESCVYFIVTDNGSGISPSQQDSIWKRGVSDQESTGLGLAFVRNIVEQMCGEVSMVSEKGVGTTVTIMLPKGEEDDDERGFDPND